MFLFSFFSQVVGPFMIKLFLEHVYGMSGFSYWVSTRHVSQQCFINCSMFLYFIHIIISKTMQVCLETLYGFHYIRICLHHHSCFLSGGIQLSLLAIVLFSAHVLNCSFKILRLQNFNNKRNFCQLTKFKNILYFSCNECLVRPFGLLVLKLGFNTTCNFPKI